MYIKHTCRLSQSVKSSFSLAETESECCFEAQMTCDLDYLITIFSFIPPLIGFSCWSVSLDNITKQHVEKSTKHWFSLYQMIEKYVQEQTKADKEGKCCSYINT